MKRQKSKNNIVYIILVSLLCLLLLSAAGGVCYYKFYVKPNIVDPIQNFTDNNQAAASDQPKMTGDSMLDELEKVLQEDDVKAYIDKENPNQSQQLLKIVEDAKTQDKTPPPSSEAPAASAAPTASTKPHPTTAPTKAPSPTSKYDKLKSEVAPADLKDGLAISGKVDIGYILGLLNGGLTSAEKTELKKYLMSHLSSSEISRGIKLFAKYSYLM